MVRGRLADQEADDEVVVNEVFAEARRVEVGQQIDIQLLTEAEAAQQPDAPPGPTIRLRVVGVVRSLGDLSSKLAGSASDELILTPPGLEARVERAAVFYGAIFLLVDDPVAARRAVTAAFPGRLFGVSGNIARDDVAALQGTYDYEGRAAMAVAVIAVVAGLIFVGQTLARQVRREWTDLASLRSIGMSDAQIGATALTRGVPIAVGAVAIAATVALALSARSPVGLARAAEVRPGVLIDLFVMVVGLPLLAVAILLVAWFPVWRLARAPRRRRGHTAVVGNLGLPPSAAVGVNLAANGGRGGTGLPMGTALVGTALAVLAVTAAISVAASLDAIMEHPEAYGATWDVSVSALDNDEPVGLRERITDLPGITGASIMRGADLEIAGDSVWTVALEPVDSARPGIEPRIVEGRAPTGPDEIALGGLTLAATDLRIGDHVEVTSSVVGADPTSASIVGVAVVNATDESSPGYGAVMSRRGLTRLAPEAGARLFLFDLAGGDDGAAALAELRSDPNLQVAGPVLQPAVRNVVRLRKLVLVLASIVAILAARQPRARTPRFEPPQPRPAGHPEVGRVHPSADRRGRGRRGDRDRPTRCRRGRSARVARRSLGLERHHQRPGPGEPPRGAAARPGLGRPRAGGLGQRRGGRAGLEGRSGSSGGGLASRVSARGPLVQCRVVAHRQSTQATAAPTTHRRRRWPGDPVTHRRPTASGPRVARARMTVLRPLWRAAGRSSAFRTRARPSARG